MNSRPDLYAKPVRFKLVTDVKNLTPIKSWFDIPEGECIGCADGTEAKNGSHYCLECERVIAKDGKGRTYKKSRKKSKGSLGRGLIKKNGHYR